jgi:hypothetical protein
VHVFRDWSWLGSARDDGELQALLEAPPRPSFDLDVTRLLIRRYRAGTLPLVALGSELYVFVPNREYRQL